MTSEDGWWSMAPASQKRCYRIIDLESEDISEFESNSLTFTDKETETNSG